MNIVEMLQGLGPRLLGRAGTWVVTTVMGVALTLGYWTCTGDSGGMDTVDQVPAAFFDGGDTYAVDFYLNQPGWLYVSVQRDERSHDDHYLEAIELFEPGEWTVEFGAPPDTILYFDLSVTDPQPGGEVRWTILRNDTRIWSESRVMEPDYPENWGFGLVLEPEQWAEPPAWY